jgi:hypothetical protein
LGISPGYFGVLMVGFGLWVSYGIASRDLPLIVPNCVAFLVMGRTIEVALRVTTALITSLPACREVWSARLRCD